MEVQRVWGWRTPGSAREVVPPEKALTAPGPSPQNIALCTSSIQLLLSCIFVQQTVFLSAVSHSNKLLDLGRLSQITEL